MPKLTERHIEKLYQFVQQHYVSWYDVQTELVDHLANGIEQQWEINGDITFDDALNTEFKKFGIFGFHDLVDQKIKALNTHYRKEIWLHFKTFFGLPKIILTLFAIWAFYTLFYYLDEKMVVFYSATGLLFVMYFYYTFRLKKDIKDRKKKTGKQWLFDSMLLEMGGIIHFFLIAINLHTFFDALEWTNTTTLMASAGFVLFVLLLYIAIKMVPEKLKRKFSKQNPEYNYI